MTAIGLCAASHIREGHDLKLRDAGAVHLAHSWPEAERFALQFLQRPVGGLRFANPPYALGHLKYGQYRTPGAGRIRPLADSKQAQTKNPARRPG
jgi:hypothetical protein